jgi:hypothetical protein
MALNLGALHPDILTSAAKMDFIPRRGDADYISGREGDGAIFASLGDDIRLRGCKSFAWVRPPGFRSEQWLSSLSMMMVR